MKASIKIQDCKDYFNKRQVEHYKINFCPLENNNKKYRIKENSWKKLKT